MNNMGSVKDMNPFKVGNRVKYNDKNNFMYGLRGAVVDVMDVSTYVLLDNSVVVITSFKNLVKLKKKNKPVKV